MNDSKNDEMAGSVSEPGVPEVKPAKSLWPRPYDNVRVEPSLEPAQVEDAPVIAPSVSAPEGDFDTVPAEGYQERTEPRMDAPEVGVPDVDAPEVGPARLDEPAPSLAPEDIADFAPASEDERTVEDIIEEKEAAGEETRTVEDILDEKEATEDAAGPPESDLRADRTEPSLDAASQNDEAPAVTIDPQNVREDERTAAVLGAADHQQPALPGSGENRSGQIIAMAAGIIVALALGTAALVYGASALGFSFGGGGDTVAANNPPAPVPTPVVTQSDDELKAAQQRIAELQAQLERLEAEKAEAAKADEAANGEQTAAAPEPVPAPAPRPVAVAPAPTPAPTPEPAATAPSSPATPAASANRTADAAPATPAPAQTPPQQTARVEPGPGAPPRPLAPPPSYETQPGYQQPARTATPEMPILQNWAVRDVYNGVAVVQSGRGAPMEVEPGDELPGGNRVLAIRRLGGAWAVVTERGIIAAR